MPRMLIIVGLIAIISWGAACGEPENTCCGGSCGYEYHPGTCTRTGENAFSFEGIIDGQVVLYSDNQLAEPDSMEEGESTDCSLMWMSRGTCAPCMFSLGHMTAYTSFGGCGEEAWAGFRCRNNSCE